MRLNLKSLLCCLSILLLGWMPLSHATQNPAYKGHVKNLTQVDAFHPPVQGDGKNHLYKEWHYFTMSSESGDVTFGSIFTVEGDVWDATKSYSLKIDNYQTPEKSALTLDIFPMDMVKIFSDKPDFHLDKNSISYDGHVYRIYTESSDGQVIFDATWKPLVKPEQPVPLPMRSASGDDHVMNWLITSAAMEVNGSLIVGKGTAQEKKYRFSKARGYHDHNWGYWDWADDFGWDWGQAVERSDIRCQKDFSRFKRYCKHETNYSIALLNMTDSNDAEIHSSVLKIWNNGKKLATFSGSQMAIEHKMMSVADIPGYYIPEINYISAVAGRDRLDIVFRTQNYFPIFLPIEQGYRIIWELKGSFEVKGMLNGKPVNYVTDGSMEYLGAPLLN